MSKKIFISALVALIVCMTGYLFVSHYSINIEPKGSVEAQTLIGTYVWDSAGMTDLPDAFVINGEREPRHFVGDYMQVRQLIFGTSTLPYSGSDSCSVDMEQVSLHAIVTPTGLIDVKDVNDRGHLSAVTCAH